jgi:hypothetical protein
LIRKLPNGATFFQDIDDVATPHEAQTPKRIAFKRVAIPASLKDKEYLRGKGICCSEYFLSKDRKQKDAKISEILPDVHFPLCCEKGDARTCEGHHDFRECLARKPTAPEKVKTFQSLAHKK